MADEAPRGQGFRTVKWAKGTPNEVDLYQCTECPWDTFERDEMSVHVAWHKAGSPQAVASR